MPSAPVFSQEISSFCSEWFSADSQDIPSACLQWASASAPGWKLSAKQSESCSWAIHKDKLRSAPLMGNKMLNPQEYLEVFQDCNSSISIYQGWAAHDFREEQQRLMGTKPPSNNTQPLIQHLALSDWALHFPSQTCSVLLCSSANNKQRFWAVLPSFSFDFASLLPALSSVPWITSVCCS